MDEGYIKFNSRWAETPAYPMEDLHELIMARQQLFEAGLIGAYPSGIGFGNISLRHPIQGNPDAFYISGSATGNVTQLSPAHFALVTKVDIEKNCLDCEGPIIASSESMSHAVIYRECPEVQAVAHIHDLTMWESLLHKVPTTDSSATYGTPEMAISIIDLLRNTDLKQSKLFVMEGHEEGVFAFGNSLEETVGIILDN
ncbi:MAG: class II aldolase/adducin family protein [Bacteroidetes bacterium]|nr:MAG: class II aldolase/adducin family protein [Bacteroidota bacterium]